MSTAAKHCLNCGTEIGGVQFCPQCGQRASTSRITWRDTLRDIYRQLLEGDNPWPRTLQQMNLDAGGVAREYVAGKRARYVHPLRYAFYMVLVATVLTSSQAGFSPSVSPLLPAWRIFLLENIPVFLLLISPVAALALRVAFWKPYNLAEIWVFVLFLLGQLSLVFAAMELLFPFVSRITDELVRSVLGASALLLLVVYYTWAVRRFFGVRLDWSLVGALASLAATVWAASWCFIWLGSF